MFPAYRGPVSDLVRDVSGLLLGAPLASARDIARMLGRNRSVVHRVLRRFRDDGLAECVSLSWYTDSVLRWRFTNRGLVQLFDYRMSWHDEWALCRLLDRLAPLESFYQIAGSVPGMGRLMEFQWLDGLGIDAAARYEGGWVAFFWSGHLQSEDAIGERLERFGREIEQVAVMDDMAWPGMFCFVVPDPWQGELVLRAARRYGLEINSAVWCVSDQTCLPAPELRPSRGWIFQYPPLRDLGGWSFTDRVDSSLASMTSNLVCAQVLDAVVQWPGISVRMVRSLLKESGSGRRGQVALMVLLEHGLVSREAYGREYRYFAANRGLHLLGLRDRVNFARVRRRSEGLSWLLREDRRSHEEGVMSMSFECAESGMAFAPGWRTWEHLGNMGLAPDALLRVLESPYGPGWCYLEYERSARSLSKVSRKLRGYGSSLRQDDWPVLVVSWDARSEAVFHEVGAQLGLRMLTTTLERVSEHPVLGGDSCWTRYGRPAFVA